jgi:hypothetical protein
MNESTLAWGWLGFCSSAVHADTQHHRNATAMSLQHSRGDRRFGFPNDMTERELFQLAISQAIEFSVDTYDRLGSTTA